MSGITLTAVADTTIPTPPTDKSTLFFDAGTGEPSVKDDAGAVTSLKGATGPAASPGGADKAVQYNDAGVLGGESTFQYDKTTDTLTVGSVNLNSGGLVATAASGTAKSGLRVPHGSAPTSPTNGDVWTTTAGMYVRVNGVTVGPLGAAGSAAWGGITGTLSAQTDLQAALDAKAAVGIPQNSQSAAYTLVLGDANKHVYHPSADTTARIWTIPANGSVAFPIGTAVTFVNDSSAGVVTIAITTDTLVWQPTGGTGSRTLAANGQATALKITSTRWVITGVGLT